MNLRRRPKPTRVRHELRNMPESPLLNEYSERIVALRTSMKKALLALEDGEPKVARNHLREGLSESWWA